MKYNYFLFTGRYRMVLALLLGLMSCVQAIAQNEPLYANSIVSQSTAVCRQVEVTVIGTVTTKVEMCGNGIVDAYKAVDGDFNSAATLTNALVNSTTRLRMGFPKPVPAGYRTGVVVSNSKNLTDANLVGNVRLYTYDKNSNVAKEEVTVDLRVLRSAVMSTTPVRLEFMTRFTFDDIEIKADRLLDVAPAANQGTGLQLHYAYGVGSNVVEEATGVLSRLTKPTDADYSTVTASTGIVDVCVNSNVVNPKNAVDADLTNFAKLSSLVGVSCPTATLQVKLEGKAEAGYQAGFVIGNGGTLDLDLLRTLKIRTYLGDQVQETAIGAELLQLTLLPSGQYEVSFPSTKAFDRIEIEQSSLVNALSGLNVYYGFGIEPRAFRDTTPILSDNTDPKSNNEYQTAQSNVLCVGCSISNPEKAADNNMDANDFATVSFGAQVAGTQRLKLLLNEQTDATTGQDVAGQAGDRAGVVIGNGGLTGLLGLLDISVLSNITITTYSGDNGGTPVESASGSSILNLKTLADGRGEVSFMTTRDFDWVEIEVSNTLGLLNNTRVYYGFADQKPLGFPQTITPPRGPLPVELLSFQGKAVGSAVELTWQTASEHNNSHFLLERASGTNATFRAIGRVAGYGSTNSRQRYAFRDEAPIAATTNYYRLRQVDTDGTEAPSAVVVVRSMAALAQGMEVYPNPAAAGETVNARLPMTPAAGDELVAYDAQGREVYHFTVNGTVVTLPSSKLRAGLYHIVLRAANGQPLAKQRLLVVGAK